MASTRFVELLSSEGLSTAAARKRLERAQPPIAKLPDLELAHRSRFWFLEDQYRKDEYWANLVAALDQAASGVALHALDAHGGLIPAAQFETLCGSPRQGTKHLLAADVRRQLLDLGLVEEWQSLQHDDWLRVTSVSGFAVQSERERRPTLLAERVLLEAFKEWTRKIGLVSYDTIRIRGDVEAPEFGGFGFDYSAPSYVRPLSHADNPGFLVADVVYRKELAPHHCDYFRRKCSILRSTANLRPFIGALIAQHFELDAFTAGRRDGLLFVTPRNLFGEAIERAIDELVRLMRDAAAAAHSGSVDQLTDIFKALSPFAGALQQIRGPFFNLIVGHCLSRAEGDRVDIDRDVIDPKTGLAANIDVLHIRGERYLTACECKGKLSEGTVSVEEAHDWRTRQVPRIEHYLRSQPEYRERQLRFELWTSGKFAPDAQEFLEDTARSTRRYTIAWKDGRAVRAFIREHGLTSIGRLLDQFYQDAR